MGFHTPNPQRAFLALVMPMLVYLFSIHSTFSQSPKFERINTRNGLSHNSVICIRQDSRGFMWFGTYGGLNKFDGYKITTYQAQHGEKNSLKVNAIVSIFEDSDHFIWLGTYGGGVVRFDPRLESFKEYRYLHLDSTQDVVANVRSFYEDADGFLWLASSEGLVKFDKEKEIFTPYLVKADVHADNNITNICKSRDNLFWLGSYLGIKKFDPRTQTFKVFKPENKNPNSISHPNVLALYEDNSGLLWIGTEGGGLDVFDPKNETFQHYQNDPDDVTSISGNVIYDIKPYTPGKLLVATDWGLNIVDIASRKFERIFHDPEDNTSLSGNNVRSIYINDEGILWVGTDGAGVNRTDIKRKQFSLFQHKPNKKGSLSNNNVFAITEDSFGKIWVGTIDGGLNVFDPKVQTFSHFLPDPTDKSSISSSKILSLSTGPSGNLWIGTDRDGLCMLPKQYVPSGRKNSYFFRFYKDEKPNSLNSNVIYSILEDHEGTVWAGTWSRGLNKLTFESKKPDGSIDYSRPVIKHYRKDNDDSTSISHDVVFTLYEDSKGTLWIGTVGGGLNKREEMIAIENGRSVKKDVFRQYVNHPEDTTSLSDNNVSAIYESKDGNFWVGTSLGVNKMDRATGTCKVYTTKHGLPNNVVFGIIEDSKGFLWIGTLGGMSKFDPQKETFTNYTYEDGLQDNMFNPHAFCFSKNGEMYFGGPNGITTFFPDSITDNPYKPSVMLTDFKVLNKHVNIGEGEENIRISESIVTAKDITLSYKDYVFSFEFSASSYANPLKNRFAYRMEGFDPDWVYVDAGNRDATYTNLDPGEYVFHVKAANNDGIWNEEGTSIRIKIIPPFWSTLAFQIASIMFIGGLLFAIYRFRINLIQKQKDALEYLVAVRTKEVVSQKEEIQSQKESIEEKNVILEKQFHEIESARHEIDEKNKKLKDYNQELEQMVKQRTEQLRMAFDNLEESNRELDQFIYRSAHDLKGPLASIRGLCYLGTLETEDPKITDLLLKMEQTTEELTKKLSRLMKIHEYNSIPVNLEPVNYTELLKEIMDQILPDPGSKNIELSINVENKASGKTDKHLIRILLTNMIENSIKYKDDNKPRHYVNIEIQFMNQSTVISVRDNGVGIPAEQADRIFDLFVIASENIKGFGIGLYEAKLIARRLNGSIKLRYPENGDTEFVITV